MKFGGTSVEDSSAIDRLVGIVRDRLAEQPVVVASAMAKVTDQLIATSKAAGSGDTKEALSLARALRERHYAAAGALLGRGGSTISHSSPEVDIASLDELF